MIRLGIAGEEPEWTVEERRWHREARSAWLRLAVLGILIVNLLVGEHHGSLTVHEAVVGSYALVTVVALGLALTKYGPARLGAMLVIVDAVAVVALLHEHLYERWGSIEHSLTTTSLAIAFVLLNHVSLRLRSHLVLLYAGIVLVGWLLVLALVHLANPSFAVLAADSTLATAFAFASFVAFLLVHDHNSLLRSAIRSERRRVSLSRFFSPSVVAELQSGRAAVDLERRIAAVMFIDLRSFTRFAESASPHEVAELLIDYRTQVTQAVFDLGGTVDKFMGDGVMAVFGQPRSSTDDAERALRCALYLSEALARWKLDRSKERKPALDAGIGLHVGPVIGGVLESGQHHEFTVVGDAVNISQRLERAAKALNAALVVSAETLAAAPGVARDVPWSWKDNVELEGRSGAMRIAYLPRERIVGGTMRKENPGP
jgi:adenylate cyclase